MVAMMMVILLCTGCGKEDDVLSPSSPALSDEVPNASDASKLPDVPDTPEAPNTPSEPAEPNESTPAADEYTFTVTKPASFGILNATIDGAVIGDERQFVVVVEQDAEYDFAEATSRQVTLEAGKTYLVAILLHNSADESLGEAAAVKHPSLAFSFPEKLTAGTEAEVAAVVAYDAPDGIPDDAISQVAMRGNAVTVSADQNVRLEFSDFDGTVGIKLFIPVMADQDLTYAAANPVIDDGRVVDMTYLADIRPGYRYARFVCYSIKVVADE